MPSAPNPSERLVSQFASDPEMAELVEFFVTELPSRIEQMNAAWQARRVPDLTRLAHQLKGASAGYGFPTIGQAAGQLEHGLKKLGTASPEAAVQALAKEFRELVELCARASRKG